MLSATPARESLLWEKNLKDGGSDGKGMADLLLNIQAIKKIYPSSTKQDKEWAMELGNPRFLQIINIVLIVFIQVITGALLQQASEQWTLAYVLTDSKSSPQNTT